VANQKIQVLSDCFNQGAVNTALWGPATGVDGTAYSIGTIATGTSTQTLTLTLGPSGSAASASLNAATQTPVAECLNSGLTSLAAYDLTNSGTSVRLASVYEGDTGIQAWFALSNGNGTSADWLGWQVYDLGGGLFVIAAKYGNPTFNWPNPSSPSQAQYIPAKYQYLRIVENSGTVYWDYSADGVNWTNFTSMATPFDVTGMYASVYGTTTSGSTPVQWANVNYSLSAS
jgi:hypothetical protein